MATFSVMLPSCRKQYKLYTCIESFGSDVSMSTPNPLTKAICVTKPKVNRIGCINDLQESMVKVGRETVIVNQ